MAPSNDSQFSADYEMADPVIFSVAEVLEKVISDCQGLGNVEIWAENNRVYIRPAPGSDWAGEFVDWWYGYEEYFAGGWILNTDFNSPDLYYMARV